MVITQVKDNINENNVFHSYSTANVFYSYSNNSFYSYWRRNSIQFHVSKTQVDRAMTLKVSYCKTQISDFTKLNVSLAFAHARVLVAPKRFEGIGLNPPFDESLSLVQHSLISCTPWCVRIRPQTLC